MATHGYGYIPDEKDERDFLFQALRPRTAPLPASVDLRHLCSPVRDQGRLGSCTGFAIAVGMREFLLKKLGMDFVKLSPLFVYYEERLLENTLSQDSGAQPRDGMKVLVKMGCAPENDDRYSVRRYKKAPSAQAVADASGYKVASYHRLPMLSDMQACLADGSGFILGFRVYESFESQSVAQTGKMPMPQPGEAVLGGHAVFAVGYQTDPGTPGGGYLIIKNSWGKGWGDKGYFYMPFAYVTPKLVSDAWVAVM